MNKILNSQSQQTQLSSRLGVEVLQGCNLTDITDQQRNKLKTSLWEHGVIVVRKQNLTATQLAEFAQKTFGRLKSDGRTPDPEISPDLQGQCVYILGNPKSLVSENKKINASHEWHYDKDHIPRTEGLEMNALYVVMVHGVEIPPSGLDGQPHKTQFLDMIEAYNNLSPQHQQELEPISMYHLPPVFDRQAEIEVDVPKKQHPIVSTHKVTGKKGLYIGSHGVIRVDLQDKPEQAKQFWSDLFQTVLQSTPVYSHIWQKGDIIFWDNSQVMHRGTPYDASKHTRIGLRLGVVDMDEQIDQIC